MKFVYGKQDWKTKERGEENCYLLTNGLGGFSSCTMIGSNTRNDHALFMACTKAPNFRVNLIHRLEEVLETDEKRIHLSSQDYLDPDKNEGGSRYLNMFSFEDYPSWKYTADGIEVTKEIAMKQGDNLIAVRYYLENRTEKDAGFVVIPHLQFVPKKEKLRKGQIFSISGNRISSNGYSVWFDTNAETEIFPQVFCENLYYAYDACDGRDKTGNTCMNHRLVKKIPAGKTEKLEIVYRMNETKITAEEVFREAVLYRDKLVQKAGFKHPLAKTLVKSANQFIVDRESTNGKTILAGYPFFEDWGRDTMIAIVGCCISSGQYEAAKSIFRTFAAYCRKGLMPNLFPEGENLPMYNTADAALLFIHALYLYYEKSHDAAFIEEMWNVMEQIIYCYENGTSFNIHMDEDGLIVAGSGLDQVTWMDVRIGEILPTPRHGKPVEINAYWYNALKIMTQFGRMLCVKKSLVEHYYVLSGVVKESFGKKFWNEEKGCLRDVLSGTKADEQIRCNQIWTISMPFSVLDEEKEKKVVDVVYEKLYTPYGLRTLEKKDAEFQAYYGGEQLKRDLSYHQGTVWTFPLGGYYLAYLKVHHYSETAKRKVTEQLEVLESALREGCIGQLPEIYDGENPTSSRGCFAQAWSVGELLRVFAELENAETGGEKIGINSRQKKYS